MKNDTYTVRFVLNPTYVSIPQHVTQHWVETNMNRIIHILAISTIRKQISSLFLGGGNKARDVVVDRIIVE